MCHIFQMLTDDSSNPTGGEKEMPPPAVHGHVSTTPSVDAGRTDDHDPTAKNKNNVSNKGDLSEYHHKIDMSIHGPHE
jgi:hypothetical protein